MTEETVDTVFYNGAIFRITSVSGAGLPSPVWYGIWPLTGDGPNNRGYQMWFALEGSQLVLNRFNGNVSAKEAEKGFQPINGVSPKLEGTAPVGFDYSDLHLKVEFSGTLGIRPAQTESGAAGGTDAQRPGRKMGLRFEKGLLMEEVGADAAGEDDSEKYYRHMREKKAKEMTEANRDAGEFEAREKVSNEFNELVAQHKKETGQDQKSEKVQEEEMAAAMLQLKILKDERRRASAPADGTKCLGCGSACKTGAKSCPECGAKL